MTPNQDEVAYHEAGHAVVAHLLQLRVTRVRIDPIDQAITEFDRASTEAELAPYRRKTMPKQLRARWEKDLKVGFGGFFGTRYLFKKHGRSEIEFNEFLQGGSIDCDNKDIREQLERHHARPRDVRNHRRQLLRDTEDLLRPNDARALIDHVAAATADAGRAIEAAS